MRQVMSNVWQAVAIIAVFMPERSSEGLEMPIEIRVWRLAFAAVVTIPD
jgi:hypothetical protein